MQSQRDLFYDAQRDYVERFVLGIDPRRHEIVHNNLDHIKRWAASDANQLAPDRTEAKGSVELRRARFEGQIEKFSSTCFVLDPSVRANGDNHIGYIGNILFEDTIESLIDTIV